MILDSLLLLAICIPTMALVRGPLQAAAGAMFASFVMVAGYEWMTGGYAVDGAYVVADVLCAAGLTFALMHYPLSRPATLVAVGYWVCCIIHGMKLMGVVLDVQLYWWTLRIVNACQLLLIGGAGVWHGGKRLNWRSDVLHFGRRSVRSAASRVRNAER